MAIDRKIFYIGWEPEHYDYANGFIMEGNGLYGLPLNDTLGISTTVRSGILFYSVSATYTMAAPYSNRLSLNLNPITQSGEALDSSADFWVCLGYENVYISWGTSPAVQPQIFLSDSAGSNGISIATNDNNQYLTVTVGGTVLATSRTAYSSVPPGVSAYGYEIPVWVYGKRFRFILGVSGWGTANTTVVLRAVNSDGTTVFATTTITNIDTTAAPAFDILHHCAPPQTSYWNGNYSQGAYLFTYITNFDPLRCYFDYVCDPAVPTSGGFSGNTTPFPTQPPVYGQDYNGLYTNTINSYALFPYQTYRDMSATYPTRHAPLAFAVSASANMSGTNQVGSIVPIVQNADGTVIADFGDSATVPDSGKTTVWSSFADPFTGGNFIDGKQTTAYTFGVKRVG